MCGRFVQSLTAVEYLEALGILHFGLPEGAFEWYAVGREVGRVKNEGPEPIRPCKE